MTLNRANVRQLLAAFDLTTLFREELGWDNVVQPPVKVRIDDKDYQANAVAEKRGMVAYIVESTATPDSSARRKIEAQVRRTAHEHLVVFVDIARTHQIWQWVRREAGRPSAVREHTYAAGQSGESLIQKLDAITFSLEEESILDIVSVSGRVRRAFDVETVTRRFYDRFKAEHEAFLGFVEGIDDIADREWYASLMLNRLMFVYFIQKRGFLDGNTDYLRVRLEAVQAQRGANNFMTFYRAFLRRLFHEGFGNRTHDADLVALIGQVPYLNGGLFEMHQLEQQYTDLEIPDEAFTKVFDFFDAYEWHLDTRRLHADNEINPDVLGFIFEKYINQKQMGAYYTREDVTGYMSANTVLPALLAKMERSCAIAFYNPHGPVVWDALATDPKRYLSASLDEPVDNPDAAVLAAEARAASLEKLRSGQIATIADLVTANLNLGQFVQDVIDDCEGPDLLRAAWEAVRTIAVLDPTCGSGAFLFAVLNLLEPVYEACLNRMESFLEEASNEAKQSYFADFVRVTETANQHVNRRYYIFKSIILNNLYGVDIMEEAVEICKLRLFLKLAAETSYDPRRPNGGIEPLPDVDFNVRAGNSLVGYINHEDVRDGLGARLDGEELLGGIEEQAAQLQQAVEEFKADQIFGDVGVNVQTKAALNAQLAALRDSLDAVLSTEYGVDPTKPDAFARWRRTHQPFHWYVDFYGILSTGGFDVVVGNPPYVEYTEVSGTYTVIRKGVADLGNLHGMVTDLCLHLMSGTGTLSLIVPVALPSTDRFQGLRAKLTTDRDVWVSHYDFRPSKLFSGANQRLTIFITRPGTGVVHSTRYQRWYSEERPQLFGRLTYTGVQPGYALRPVWPKVGDAEVQAVMAKVQAADQTVATLTVRASEHVLYYKNTGILYHATFTREAPVCFINGERQASSRETILRVADKKHVPALHAILNSSLFYLYYVVNSSCRDLNPSDITSFRVPKTALTDATLVKLSNDLDASQQENSVFIVRNQRRTGEVRLQSFRPGKSEAVLAKIDARLGNLYGLTDAETEYVRTYDHRFRFVAGADGDDG